MSLGLVLDCSQLIRGRRTMWIALLGLATLLTLRVSAQNPGFLSLDCGSTQSFVDTLGLEWVPDDKYITTGSVASVSSEYSPSREYETLRYFPPKRKHCYALPVTANSTYIVRPSFFYGNYDGLENPPSFDLQIDANFFYSLSLDGSSNDTWYVEFLVAAPNDTLNFCVASTSASSVPFISALELRPMGPGMYPLYRPNQALIMLRRVNVGATSSDDVRYPDDKYDRIWRSDNDFNTYPIIRTNSTISPGKGDQPPSLVMQTAIISNTSILFNFPLSMSTATFYITFYFAEFATLSSNQLRELDININDTSSERFLFGPFNVQGYFNGSSLRTLEFRDKYEPLNGAASFLFLPTNRSTLGPILNAAEIFQVLSNLSPGTDPDDVRAINGIKSHFNLLGWSGDPCLPVQYAWDWITCDFLEVPARIIALNLSNFQLIGTIPQNLTRLTHLTKILLDNNKLQGFIPDFSSLQNLTILHLQNNNLSGSLPNSLFNIPNLQELLLQNNNLNACFPQQAVGTGLTVNVSSNAVSSCTTNPKMLKEPKKKTRSSTIILAVAIPSAVVLLLLGILLIVLCSRKAARTSSKTHSSAGDDDGSRKKKIISPRKFTYNEIVKATDNFQKELGKGGFGVVYYGRLSEGQEVAVKIHSELSTQGEQEFKNEIDVLSIVHHKNLVSYLGYCNHGSELILIYEYMSNGTLRGHLYGTSKAPLGWKPRLNIALDAAQGLDYLHTACNPQIIHRDVKSSNILLNSAFVPKVADFGLSVLYNKDEASYVSTLVKGTVAYLDPEYYALGRLTDKSDVYSFGVVLLEIICGQGPIVSLPEEQVSLIKWVSMGIQKGELETVVDPKLLNYNKQSMWKAVEVAMACTEYESVNRPTMNRVVNELKEAMRLEDTSSVVPFSQHVSAV